MDDLIGLVFGTYPSWSHLVVRVVLGIIFFAHGAQKTFGWFGGHGLSATIGGFRQMSVPPAATVIAAFTECFGGLAMIVGLLARPAALGLVAVMVVAIVKVHGKHGFFLNFSMAPGKGHGYEYNLALMAMALSILIGGAGAISIDRLIVPFGD
ncbi:MAG: DoxX family protein [Candidatus Rokuibacteriota bacterium]|nr:MAG: DoxX family protein [Candidatus Rokubacteria bacterium]